MSNRTITLTDELYDYLLSVSLREHDLLRRLREETAEHPMVTMQIAPEQGQFMAMLVRLTRARKTLEVGVFTGYSALAVALALPADGRVVACDISEEYTSVARRYWAEAGVAHMIDLHIAPAADTLAVLQSEGNAGTFDFAFIDADKTGYDSYYEHTLQLLRPGGLILFDNVLRDGRVVGPERDDADTLAIVALNEKLHRDERIDLSLVPIGDGLTMARKRG